MTSISKFLKKTKFNLGGRKVSDKAISYIRERILNKIEQYKDKLGDTYTDCHVLVKYMGLEELLELNDLELTFGYLDYIDEVYRLKQQGIKPPSRQVKTQIKTLPEIQSRHSIAKTEGYTELTLEQLMTTYESADTEAERATAMLQRIMSLLPVEDRDDPDFDDDTPPDEDDFYGDDPDAYEDEDLDDPNGEVEPDPEELEDDDLAEEDDYEDDLDYEDDTTPNNDITIPQEALEGWNESLYLTDESFEDDPEYYDEDQPEEGEDYKFIGDYDEDEEYIDEDSDEEEDEVTELDLDSFEDYEEDDEDPNGELEPDEDEDDYDGEDEEDPNGELDPDEEDDTYDDDSDYEDDEDPNGELNPDEDDEGEDDYEDDPEDEDDPDYEDDTPPDEDSEDDYEDGDYEDDPEDEDDEPIINDEDEEDDELEGDYETDDPWEGWTILNPSLTKEQLNQFNEQQINVLVIRGILIPPAEEEDEEDDLDSDEEPYEEDDTPTPVYPTDGGLFANDDNALAPGLTATPQREARPLFADEGVMKRLEFFDKLRVKTEEKVTQKLKSTEAEINK